MNFFKDSLGFKHEDIIVVERGEFFMEKNPLDVSKRGTLIKDDEVKVYGWRKSEET